MHRPILKPGPSQVTPELKALFDPGDPASLRCFAVLEGNLAGRFLADNSSHPAWGIVQEAAYGTIYLGGALDASLVSEVVVHNKVWLAQLASGFAKRARLATRRHRR